MVQLVTNVLAWIGGLWAFMQILNYLLFRRPRLKGDIERVVVVEHVNGTAAEWYPEILLLVYVVNARFEPTTLRRWSLKVRQYHAVYTAAGEPIDDETLKGLPHPISLADYTAHSVMEYGHGIWGWLRFEVRDILGGALERGCRLEITALDSMDHTHKIHGVLRPGEIERLHQLRRPGR
jgi:hypothetical protein